MIDIVAWRACIGTFLHPIRAKCSSPISVQSNEDYTLSARLSVIALTLWFLYTEHLVIGLFLQHIDHCCTTSTHMSTSYMSLNESPVFKHCTNIVYYVNHNTHFVNTLALANDVETNPGPLTQELQQVIDAINDNINVKFDTLQHQFADLAHTVKGLKDEISTINSKVSTLSSNATNMDSEIQRLQTRIQVIEEETEKQEQYSRRENVILHGIGEHPGETVDSIRSRVTTLLNNNVKVKTWQDADIVRAHRLMGHQHSDPSTASPLHIKPRPIIVRFHQFQDKLAVLKARPQMKSIDVGVSGDLTRKQRDKLRQLPDDVRGYFKGGRLHTEPRITPRTRKRIRSEADSSPSTTTDTQTSTPNCT